MAERTEKDPSLTASSVVDRLAVLCTRIGLRESIGESVLVEAIRIVASDIGIADWTGLSLIEVIENPEIGIQEISPRAVKEVPSEVWNCVRRLAQAIDWPFLTPEESNLSACSLTKYLEAVHAITAYGDIRPTTSGIQPNRLSATRKASGAFYTPSSVARFICEGTIGLTFDNLLRRINSGQASLESLNQLMCFRVIDPACGPGTFLIEALKAMKSRYAGLKKALDQSAISDGIKNPSLSSLQEWLSSPQSYINHQVRLLYGVDIDGAAAEIAAVCLAATAQMSKTNLKSLFLDTVKAGDSLVSELAPGSLRPTNELANALLMSRERMRCTQSYAERKTLYKEFRETIRAIQRDSFVAVGSKPASETLPKEQLDSAFCWELEFPEVFLTESPEQYGGFSSAVMNPPYDILKLNRSEYLRPEQSSEERGLALREFQKLKETERYRAGFFRKSGQYRWSAGNVINLYRLMIERAIRVTSPNATLGFIVPSTLLCDSSAAKLRQVVFKDFGVLGIDDFAEKANVFEGVTQAVCILRLDKSAPPGDIPIAVHASNSIADVGLSYHMLPIEMIESVSGSSLSLPRVPYESCRILKKIHKWSVVADQKWIVNRRGELDLTLYKQFITFENTGTRLVRGNHIGRYAVKWKCEPKECYVHSEGFFQQLGASSKLRDITRTRIAGQQICNMSQKWRLKFGVVEPKVVLGNSCNYILTQGTHNDEKHLMFLLALMNSHLLNWRFKMTSTNNHVNNNEIDMLPIPSPSALERHQLRVFNRICENAMQLASKVSDALMFETEALVFALYGLEEEEALTVLKYQRASPAETEAILQFLSQVKRTAQS